MNILIIGGTSGIGLALAQHYLTNNNTVTICGRNLQKVPESIQCENLSMITLDITKEHDIVSLFTSLKHKTIDLLIYCAGKYFNERRLVLNKAEKSEMLAVNGTGFIDCFKLASKHMIAQGHGHLATIASVAGLINSSAPSLYSQLKSQMIIKAKEYALQLATHNINVTVIAPGYINTQKLRDLNNGDASNKPFLIEEGECVLRITEAIKHQKSLTIFPLKMKALVILLNSLPSHLVTYLLNRRG